ncbi:hypothetical protein JN06_02327 [Bacteroides zoogleoformans]|nr:hypothetical protein JN06_02327 [Bacteroides zoogleoformans]
MASLLARFKCRSLQICTFFLNLQTFEECFFTCPVRALTFSLTAIREDGTDGVPMISSFISLFSLAFRQKNGCHFPCC